MREKALGFTTVLLAVVMTVTVSGFHGPSITCYQEPLPPRQHPAEPKRANPADITTVHVISMNHLDVGYNGISPQIGYIYNVINRYFDIHFPQALSTIAALKAAGGPAQLIYTTHSWLVSFYLDCPPGLNWHCPNQTTLTAFKQAVAEGGITWHAYPFNTEPEVMDSSLFEFGVEMTHALDDRFGLPRKRTLSQRDVPGMTRSVIPLLVKHNVSALSVGQNCDTSPSDVPSIYIWRDPASQTQVLAMNHPGGYPNNAGESASHPGGLSVDDCVMIDGFSDALCWAFRTDNSGPPPPEQVVNWWTVLNAEFPNANITASTYDRFVDRVLSTPGVMQQLITVTAEIGDTWIWGVPSDPKKVAQYREMTRARTECLESGRCDPSEYAFQNFSRFLIKLPEHTWGLPSLNNNADWSNPAFEAARATQPLFAASEYAWSEQRAFINHAIEALPADHHLRIDIQQRLKRIVPALPSLDGLSRVNQTDQIFSCGALRVGFDPATGAITSLVDTVTNRQWAKPTGSDSFGFSSFGYDTFNELDFVGFTSVYRYGGDGGAWYKHNLTVAADPLKATWQTAMQSLWMGQPDRDGSCSFVQQLTMADLRAWTDYGAPQAVWITYHIGSDRARQTSEIRYDVQWFNKTSTRLPESLWFSFDPAVSPSQGEWLMDKLGSWVNPTDVMLNGSQHQHGVWQGVIYVDTHIDQVDQIDQIDPPLPLAPPPYATLSIDMVDTSVVSPDARTPFCAPVWEYPGTPGMQPLNVNGITHGMHANLYNNAWDTNYITYYPFDRTPGNDDANARFRFVVTINSQN